MKPFKELGTHGAEMLFNNGRDESEMVVQPEKNC